MVKLGALLQTNEADREALDLLKKRIGTYGLRVERYTQEELWLKNMAYFSGKQHFYIVNGQIFDATKDLPEHRIVYKVNLTRTFLMRAATKVDSGSPEMRAVPPGASMRERAIAETSEKVVEHQRELTQFDARHRFIGQQWAGICGSAFYKVYWNDQLGDPERYYFDLGPTGKRQYIDPAMLSPAQIQSFDQGHKYKDFYPGDVSLGVESPFGVFWDWSARDGGVDDCLWMASRHYVDIDTVAEAWNVDPNDLTPDADTDGFYNYEEAIAFMNSSNLYPINFGIPEEKRGRRCQYVDMWQRPTRAYPHGRRIVYAGKRILYNGKNPHAGDPSKKSHLPWVKHDWAPHPGRFMGSSLVEDLTNPQYNLNEASARVLEFLRVFGAPPTFVWKGSGMNPDKMTIDPGAIYTLNDNSRPPVFAPAPQLPAAVFQATEMTSAHMSQVASSADEQGKLPGQLRSGPALEAADEQRFMPLTATAKCAAIAIREVCMKMLAIGKLKYDTPRLLRYIGDGDQWVVRYFQASDLTHELVIVSDPGQMTSRSSTKAMLMDAVQAGALQPQTNPEHAQLITRALGMGSPSEALNTITQAIRSQEREIQEMIAEPDKWKTGGYPIADYEDHNAEYRTCVRFMYSAEFRELPPSTQAIIAAHAHMHQQALQQAAMQAMQAAAQAQAAGTAAGSGKAGPQAPQLQPGKAPQFAG